MKRKLLFTALCAVIVLQLAAVAGFITYYESLDDKIETQGTEYRFRVTLESVSPDGTIAFSIDSLEDMYIYNYVYGISNAKAAGLVVGEDGFTTFGAAFDSIPDDTAYVLLNRPNAFPSETVYESGNANLYDPAYDYLSSYYEPYAALYTDEEEIRTEQPEAYVTVRIYRGHAAITGMYIAGEDVRTLDALPEPVPIEDAGENA